MSITKMDKNYIKKAAFKRVHQFHVPVMGTSFSIDSAIKVAPYGISTVMSICDDELCENMRKFYSGQFNKDYTPIEKFDDDYRARRVRSYLDLVYDIVEEKFNTIKESSFDDKESEINKYFGLLQDNTPLKQLYFKMMDAQDEEKVELQDNCRSLMRKGSIDVNIMTKLDRNNYDKNGELMDVQYSDAIAALRGFSDSKVESGIVFSAGFNRRLYAYIENLDGFFPDETGKIKKKIILKVSDYRSSLIQGNFLAKKGIWISEYRIESGLNCGGHAFATDGYLMGPILHEFKEKLDGLRQDLYEVAQEVLKEKGKPLFKEVPYCDLTVQGGIGTAAEQKFLFDEYNVQASGWATPFLLVPEMTTVDYETRQHLVKAGKDELYLSEISPLGVPFNAVKGTMSNDYREEKIESGRPGSICPKGHLVFNQEYTKKPICTASITFQKRKINEIKEQGLSEEDYKEAYEKVVRKTCLCEDLSAGALIEYGIESKRALKPIVCPGPNLAYFSKISTLQEMVGHIYGKVDVINKSVDRSNMFINELKMYIDFYVKEVKAVLPEPNKKQIKRLDLFQSNLFDGMQYYKDLIPQYVSQGKDVQEKLAQDLDRLKEELNSIVEKYSDVLAGESKVAVAV